MLKDKIVRKESGYLFYGLTPPRLNTAEDKIQDIANKQIERIKDINIDALVLYDIQDESSRNDNPRPFPFMPTLAPDIYSSNYLNELKIPRIIYKSVGKYSANELKSWLQQNNKLEYSVFVGTPSKAQQQNLSLNDAYAIIKELNSPLTLGGVTIPERHYKKGNEHLRLFDKIDKGCSFFISQCVYSVNHSKDFLSDYYYSSMELNRKMVPVIFTLTPCGSLKTLQFMEWLGIEIPKWLHNDLKHSANILSKSVDSCKTIAIELISYAKEKNIPIGFNVESVSIRKEEIEASIELLKSIKELQLNTL
jgi:hypothetical protein